MILSSTLISDHNPGDDVAVFSTSISSSHHTIHQIFGSFTKWDSAYYLLIAKDGFYATEQLLAFFPLYPFCVQKLAEMIKQLSHLFQFLEGEKEMYVVFSAVMFSNICFILSVFVLKSLLTNLVLKSPFLHDDQARYIGNRNNMYYSTDLNNSDHSKDGNDISNNGDISCIIRDNNRNKILSGSKTAEELKIDHNCSDSSVEYNGIVNKDMRIENKDLNAIDFNDNEKNEIKKMNHESVKELVDLAVVFYLCNPATVFFCTAYTESVYALLTFTGLWVLSLLNQNTPILHIPEHLFNGQLLGETTTTMLSYFPIKNNKNANIMKTRSYTTSLLYIGAAAYFFFLSSSTRSNGLLNTIFTLSFFCSAIIGDIHIYMLDVMISNRHV
jgi:hypothetical protein